MLNPFPIQFLSLIAHSILRVTLGFVLIVEGIRMLHTPLTPTTTLRVVHRIFGILALLFGVLLIVGFLTQIAALGTMALVVLSTVAPTFVPFAQSSKLVRLLVFGSALSLFITGAGAFAFDLPL